MMRFRGRWVCAQTGRCRKQADTAAHKTITPDCSKASLCGGALAGGRRAGRLWPVVWCDCNSRQRLTDLARL